MVRPGRALSLTGASLVEIRLRAAGIGEPRRWEVRPSSMGRGRVLGIAVSGLWISYGMETGRSTHGLGPLSRTAMDV